MSRKWWIMGGAGVLVGLIVLALAVPALAQDATPTPKTNGKMFLWGRGFGLWGGSWENFDAIAKALGLTPEQLFSELHSGKTLEGIAEEKGIDLQAVQDAAKAAQVEAQKAAIEKMVEDGKLTREQADWMLKGIELGMMPRGRSFGRGFGFGGRGSFRGCPPSTAPSAAPSSSSL
jgi:hypothetical protein